MEAISNLNIWLVGAVLLILVAAVIHTVRLTKDPEKNRQWYVKKYGARQAERILTEQARHKAARDERKASNRRSGLIDDPPSVPPSSTSDTFLQATGGGWGDPPETIATDGGSQADYVGDQLAKAQAYAQQHVKIGESFQFKLTAIPRVMSPHEISFGMMMRACNYGLESGISMNETFTFTRKE